LEVFWNFWKYWNFPLSKRAILKENRNQKRQKDLGYFFFSFPCVTSSIFEQLMPRLSAISMPRAQRIDQKAVKYTSDDLSDAVSKVWECTTRMRNDSNGYWSKSMAKILKKVADSSEVPHATIRRNFLKQMDMERSGESAEDVKLAKSKKLADSQSVLSGLEKSSVYEWADYMRRKYEAPTPMEVRAKVTCLMTKCTALVMTDRIIICFLLGIRYIGSQGCGIYSSSELDIEI
jgi:hypothetical protein